MGFRETFAETYPTMDKLSKDTRYLKEAAKVKNEQELADMNLTKILKKK